MEIRKMLYDEVNKVHVTRMPPNATAKFTVHPFGNSFFTWVEFKNPSIKPGAIKSFEGNSLWGLRAETLEELEDRVNSYDCIQQLIPHHSA